MSRTITLIPGDGIGPEVTEAVVHIVAASGVAIDWEEHLAGAIAFRAHGPHAADRADRFDSRNGVALKGPVTTPVAQGFTSVNVGCGRCSISMPTSVRCGTWPACRRRPAAWTS
jgi:isocitrate dehydrogenase (NAD+)